MKKSFTKILTLVLSFLVVVALAACGNKTTKAPTEAPVNYQAILDNYLLDFDGKTVSKDFVLPKTITSNDKTYEVAWESNNAAVQIVAQEEDYLAKVTYPEATTEVTLTLHLQNLTKSFTVIVEGLEPTTFQQAYAFPKDKATVTDNFELDQEVTVQGKKATITWSVDNAYKAYIEISEDGKQCIVHQSSLNPEVMIKATFTYNGKTTTKNYRFVVSKTVTEMESVDAWYYNIGSSITISGYIVSVGAAYSDQYGNANLYVVNEDLTAGFYFYRVKADKANGAKLAAGKYVTVTGALSTNYGGLRESSSTGTAVVDESKPTKAVSEMFYAYDEDLLGNVPAALYSQSRPVSLTGWEVTEVTTEHASSSPTTVLKVKKDNVTVSIVYSKYVEDCYSYKDSDATVSAILAKVATIKVGDFVNVKGILGAYDSKPQITLMGADGIEAGTAEAAGTVHPGKLVGATIAKVQKEIEDSKLESLITATKEVTLTTKDGDVTTATATFNVKVTITPSVEAKYTLKATYTCGTYSTFDFFSVHSMAMTEKEMVDYEAENFDFDLIANAGMQEGYATHGATFANVKVSYVAADEASQPLVMTVEDNLYLAPVDVETKVKFNVTFSIGTGEDAYSVTVEGVETLIQVSEFVTFNRVAQPEANKEYYFATHSNGSGQVGAWLFADGKTTGFYLSATKDVESAVKFTAKATANENEYLLSTGGKFIKVTQSYKTEGDNKSGINTNLTYVDNESEATAFTYTGEGVELAFTFVSELDNGSGKHDTYALTQNYTNLQVYPAVKDANHFNNSNYSQYQLVEMVKDNTDTQGRATAVANALTLAKTTTANMNLPTSSQLYNDVFVSWALKEAVEGQAVANNVLTVTRGETNVDVVLVATATCGVKTATKEFTVTVEANAKVVGVDDLVTTAMAAEDGATLPGQYEVTGYVKAVTGAWDDGYKNMTVTISDASGAEVSLFRTTTQMTVGDVVTVVGYVQKYVKNDNVTIQFKQGHTVKSHTAATLITVSELYEMFKDGDATDDEKKATYLVIAPVTKVQNAAGGTYKTGNYWVSDSEAAIEAYKLGQTDEKIDVLETIKVGTVLAFYGKATVFNGTVETTPSTLLSLYQPEAPETTTLAAVKTKVDASESCADLVVTGTVELFVEGETPTAVISQTVSGTSTYMGIALPAGTKAVKGNQLVLKLASASKNDANYTAVAAEVLSNLFQSSPAYGKPIETAVAELVNAGYNQVLVLDVAVASNEFKLSETVTVKLYTDLSMSTPATLADGNYDLTGYVQKVSDSVYAFYMVKSEKALPKLVMTQESMGYSEGNNVAYVTTTPASFTVDGVTFEYKDSVGAFGNGIQLKTNGTIYNTTALTSDIYSIILFVGYNGGKGVNGTDKVYTSNFKVEVSATADFADAVELTATVDGSNAIYAVQSGSYKYVRITGLYTKTMYINSITVKMALAA